MQHLAEFVANEMFDDYRPKVFVDNKPELMAEYDKLDAKGKMEWDKKFPDWRQREEVLAYHKEKDSIRQDNEGNKLFLLECLKALEDVPEKASLAPKLTSMLARYDAKDKPVEQNRIDWDS
jgi:hypothetical protein